LFAARKTHVGPYSTWINQKDEYMAPNTSAELWNQYAADSLVYSLFHSASHQSSIGGIVFKKQEYDVRNSFFWGDPCLIDIEHKQDRSATIMNSMIQSNVKHMSQDAVDVLEIANKMLYWSGPERMVYAKAHPELHLDRWDAGYSQLKEHWKKDKPDLFKKLTVAYKILEEKLRWMTYEVGFLVK